MVRGGGRGRTGLLILVVALGTGLTAGLGGCRTPAHGEILGPLTEHEREATAVAESVRTHVAPGSCSTSEDLSALPGGLGPFSQVCVERRSAVVFGVIPSDPTVLVFGGRPGEPSVCVRQATDQWWVVVQDDDRDVVRPCPSGFTFQGA